MGSLLGLKAFVAAVLGGIGSIPGAMIGGLAIGFAEVLVSAVGLSGWTDAVVFAILIIVLLVKPTGFLGRSVQERFRGWQNGKKTHSYTCQLRNKPCAHSLLLVRYIM